MQLQGIVFIQLQGNDRAVNFQGNLFIQRTYIYSQKKYIYSRKLYSFMELYSFQGNYIHLRKLYSFNNVAFPDVAEIFIQQVSPATLQ